MLKRVRFTFRHDNCWLQETTERHGTVTLVVSSIYMAEDEIHVNITAHAPDGDLIDTIEEEWVEDDRIREVNRLYEGPKGTRFHVGYTSKHSIYPHIIHHTPISLGTVRVSQGTEYYNIVGESGDVQELLEVLDEEGTTQLQAAEDAEEVPAGEGREGDPALEDLLTDRQLQALILAYSEGYYGWPRDLSASDLAEGMDISVSTLLEHLRQAESEVLSAYVKAFRDANPARYSAIRGNLRDQPVEE